MQGSPISLEGGHYYWQSATGQENTISRASFLQVASYLSTVEIRQLKCTSKAFYQLITSDRGFVKELMKYNWEVLTLASPQLKKEPELKTLVFEKAWGLVDTKEHPLADMSLYEIPFFQKDRDVFLDAGMQGRSLECGDYKLLGDKDLMLQIVSKNGFALQWATKGLKDSKELVLKAVTQNGLTLQWASKELKDNKELVLKAVAQNGKAIQFVSDKLRGDEDVISAAILTFYCAICFASEEIQEKYPDLMDKVRKMS